jgi:hypothetical protein
MGKDCAADPRPSHQGRGEGAARPSWQAQARGLAVSVNPLPSGFVYSSRAMNARSEITPFLPA